MKKMKAFAKTKPGRGGVECLDWDVPQVGPDEVLIQVMAAGICGSDVHVYHWSEDIIKEYQPKLPLIMGHEFSGVVAEVGKEAGDWKVGDRVTANPVLYCGKCYFCKDGRQSICDNRPLIGLIVNGAFAQFVSVRSANVYKLEDKISFELGALSEVVCVAMHAIERVGITNGSTIAVVGAGPIGLTTTILAKHSGAGLVFITGLKADHERLELAKEMGAIPIEVESVDPKQRILEQTNGLGADVVFETAGASAGVIQSLDVVRKGGKVCLVGLPPGATEIHTAAVAFREIELIGTRAHTPKNWQRVSRVLLNAEEDLERVITHRLPLHLAEDGFRLMENREGLKVMILPWQ